MILPFDDFIREFIRKRENELTQPFYSAGCNGLYEDPETPIRNNSHYLFIYSYMYKKTKEILLLKKIKELEEYVLSNHYFSFTYECRNKIGKDKSNGLIGTAWLAEGLLASFEVTNNQKILERLLSIYKLYPFDYKNAIWPNRIEPNGDVLSIDRTLNHQIWFASGLANLLSKTDDKELKMRLNLFNKNLNKLMAINNGLIYHTLKLNKEYIKTKLKRILKRPYREEMKIKEVGYQYFNFLGVLILDKFSLNSFLKSKKLRFSIYKIEEKKFRKLLINNKFGYSYNPVGIEAAVTYSVLNKDLTDIIMLLNNQFNETWSVENFCFSKTNDTNTLNARMYEILYLQNKHKENLLFDVKSGQWVQRTK